jgi:hypothetical protein
MACLVGACNYVQRGKRDTHCVWFGSRAQRPFAAYLQYERKYGMIRTRFTRAFSKCSTRVNDGTSVATVGIRHTTYFLPRRTDHETFRFALSRVGCIGSGSRRSDFRRNRNAEGRPSRSKGWPESWSEGRPGYAEGRPEGWSSWTEGRPKGWSSWTEGRPEGWSSWTEGRPKGWSSWTESRPEGWSSWTEGRPEGWSSWTEGRPEGWSSWTESRPEGWAGCSEGRPEGWTEERLMIA